MTDAHANGRTPAFDLRAAAKAAATEAEDAPLVFEYQGAVYQIPSARSWPLGVVERAGAGDDWGPLMAELLGEDYPRLVAAGLSAGELLFLVQMAVRQAGFESLPNSGARAAPSSTPT